MKNKKEFWCVLFIGSLAVVLRVLYLALLKKYYLFYDAPGADVLYYRQWAWDIVGDNWIGKETFSGMPLFPYFLAVIGSLCLGNLVAVHLAHILLGTLNCFLLFKITQKIFSPKVAVFSMFLAAVNFSLIFYDWLMMPVTVLITISLIILLVLHSPEQLSRRRHWLLLGLMIALGTLGDGKFLIFFVLLVLTLTFQNKNNLADATLRVLLPLILGVILVLSAVTLRNRIVGGDRVVISSHSGLNFYIGNNPKANGAFQNPDFLRPDHTGHEQDQKIIAQKALGKNLSNREVSAFWSGRALQYIKENPLDYVRLLGKKFRLFITDNQWTYEMDMLLQKDWKDKFDFNPYRIVFAFAVLGIVLAVLYRRDTIYINLLMISQLIFILAFFLIDRHRATILPFLIIYQAHALFWLFEQLQFKQWRKFFLGLGSVLLCFTLLKGTPVNQQTLDFLQLSKAGPILDEKKEYAKAQELYLKALTLRPRDINTLYNLATSYTLDGRYADAINYFEAALALNPYDVNVHYNLAYTYEQINQKAQALQEYQRAINLIPESFDAHFRMAEIYKSLGNCSEAIKHYFAIEKIAPAYSSEVQQLIQGCQ